jgi:hypothetical protein
MRIVLMVIAAVAAIWLLREQDTAFAPALEESGTTIVAFEFAATPDRAEEILDGWGRAGRPGAEQSIRIDFAFLAAYAVLISLGTATVASWKTGWRARLGWWLAGLVIVAGLLDAIENVLLLRVIDGYHQGAIGGTATALAAAAAGLKFLIVIVASLYIMVGVIEKWGWPYRLRSRSAAGG